MKKVTVHKQVLVLCMFMLCSITNGFSQVVIKESVNIETTNNVKNIDVPDLEPTTEGIAQPGDYYYPVLRPIGFGQYIVLKSGTLNMYFKEVQLYNIPVENRAVTYSVSGPSTNLSSSVNLGEFMVGPITVEDRASVCKEEKAYYQSSLTYNVGSIKDSFIQKSRPTDDLSNSSSLVAWQLENPAFPDSAFASAFIDFGIDSLSTNALVTSSNLVLQSAENNTTVTEPFYVYYAGGPWDDSSINYNNRPPRNTDQIISVTEESLIDNTTYVYRRGITPIVDSWIRGLQPDYGIEIASEGRHDFASREGSFTGTIPTLEINLTLPNETEDNILRIGEVQAGDILTINFSNLPKGFAGNYDPIPNGEEAEEQLVFFQSNSCLSNRVVALPYISGANEDRYFEFVTEVETTIPIDSTGGQSLFREYFEPRLLYDNGQVRPSEIFTNYVMELYDIPTVQDPDGNPSLMATFFDPEEFEFSTVAFLSRNRPGLELWALNLPENSGKSFRARIVGWMIKDLIAGKVAVKNPERQIMEALSNVPEGVVVTNIEDDPNCGVVFEQVEDLFIGCFEFTIGSQNQLLVEAEPDTVYPGQASVLKARLLTAEGDTLDFPQDQQFEIVLDEASAPLGTILFANGDTLDAGTNIGPDFAFFADYNIEQDTVIKINIATIYEENELFKEVSIKVSLLPELVILQPQNGWANQQIADTPHMPIVNMNAQVLNIDENRQNSFLWEYKVQYTLERFGINGGNRFNYCPRVGECTFSGTSSSSGSDSTNWLVNFGQEFATCIARNNRPIIPDVNSQCVTQDQTTNWQAGQEDIFIGGVVSATVKVPISEEDTLFALVDSIYSIIGQNPTPAEIRNGIEVPYQVVLYHESFPRWAHFNTRTRNNFNIIGNPIYGYPNGYGLAQLDNPPAIPQQLWNWIANRQGGVNLFDEKERQARAYLLRLANRQNSPAPNFEEETNSEELLLREQLQRYNGFRYWDWEPVNRRDPTLGGTWIIVAPNAAGRNQPYGTILWNLYQNVLNENLPQGWN